LENGIVDKKLKLLIVEDSKSILNIMYLYFTEKGFECFKAENLSEAKSILNKYEINYLVLDMHLSDGLGIELLNIIPSNIKTFVLTANMNENLKNASYKKGVIDYIHKDKDFFNKISQIEASILQIEKNKLKKILIVDDSKIVQAQLKDLFENRNYVILQALGIKEAKEILLKEKIDLILLDIELKDGNGKTFLKDNKELIISKNNIPVLFISGNVTPTIIRDCLKLGAVDILRKPFIFEEIILKVDLWIDYKRKDQEIIESAKLLEQYKQAVDRSFIVSKTDPKGIITYVNDEFCNVSGYSKDEILGKSHNIIRHPDTEKSKFESLWHTIGNLKRPWMGEIKNKSKNGKEYWVKSVINPIVNSDNKIIEYISIKSDVTFEHKMKDYFEKQLNISSKKFSEAFNLSKEYENAIDNSNILSRTDINGKITYVNNHFANISGFTKEELIGSTHNIVNHPDTPKELFKEMWQVIKDGKIWQGIIKNKNKFGKPYWLNTYIIPIRDENSNIVEYMSIRHDLTDVYHLNHEIELTQREIVYKMGEIAETRSKETGHHVKRVAEYSKLLALEYGLSEKEATILFTASPMHDIGKVGIPDNILKKPAKLDFDEFEIIKTHATIGFNILKGSQREVLQAAAIVAHEHHEKWDGSGYPRGLKGEDIHIFGRITAVADVFDALGSIRCYKEAWSDEKIFQLFNEEKGRQFDPKLIDIFFNNFSKFDEIRRKYADEIIS